MLPNGWKEGKLSELISKLDAGVSVNSTARMATSSEQGILKTSCVSNWSFDPKCNKAVTASEEIERLREPVQANTILISRMNTPALVGASAYIDNDYSNLFVPDRLWQAKPKNSKVCMKWLATFLASDRGRYILSALATGTSNSMKNITKPDVLSMKLLIPPPSEQEKIVEVISAWNHAIKEAEKLIAYKQKQKKALMQRLLTGKHRFPEFEGQEWTRHTFKSIFRPYKVVNKDNLDYEVLSVTKGGIVSQSEYFNKEVASEDKSKYLIVKRNTLVMSGLNFWMGAIDFQKIRDIGIVSPAYKCFQTNQDTHDIGFFKHFVRSEIMRRVLIGASVQGASIVRRNLDNEMLINSTIVLPSIPEQQKIAAVLNAADKEIDLLTQKLEANQEQKKGLMQQLLTGKKRVKISRKEAA